MNARSTRNRSFGHYGSKQLFGILGADEGLLGIELLLEIMQKHIFVGLIKQRGLTTQHSELGHRPAICSHEAVRVLNHKNVSEVTRKPDAQITHNLEEMWRQGC